MSRTAFGSLRVRTALDAIGTYLEEGAKIAAGVSPAHVIRLETDSATRVTDVVPEVIKFTGTPKTFDLDVTGSNLLNAKTFKLVRGADEITTTNLTIVSASAFKAHFTNIPAPPQAGLYDARVIDDQGVEYTLDDACRIKVRKGGTGGGTGGGGKGARGASTP